MSDPWYRHQVQRDAPIPILVDGALMPRSSELPDDLKPLVRRNAVEVTHSRFNADLGRLIATLEKVLGKANAVHKQSHEVQTTQGDAQTAFNGGLAGEEPILEIQELGIQKGFTEKGEHFILFFVIENVSNVVCKTHFLTIRIPLKIRSRQVIIDDNQAPFNGQFSHYVDDKSQSTAHVVELEGGNIYPGQKIRKALRILPVGNFGDALNAICSRTGRNLSVKLFSDPPSKVKGQTEMTAV